ETVSAGDEHTGVRGYGRSWCDREWWLTNFIGPRDGANSRGRGLLAREERGERSRCRVVLHRPGAELHVELLLDHRHGLEARHRVAAHLEEVVVGADPIQCQHIGEDLTELRLDVR